MLNRRDLICGSVGCLAIATETGALGQVLPSPEQPVYPSKPIHLISFGAPGTGTDTVSRILAVPLSRALGQAVVVENKPGGDGVITGSYVARAPADGYTLMMGTNSPLIAAPLLHKNNLAELLAYARANPGKLMYATGNTAAILASAQLLSYGDAKMLHVPYKSEVPAISDVVSGVVQVMFAQSVTSLGLIREGKVRVLATANPRRTLQLPDLPTVAEAGLPRFSLTGWAALYGPARLPREIVDRINREVVAALKLPEVREQLEKQDFDYSSSTPAEMDAFLREQIGLWKRSIQDLGLVPE
jgi:tripartite-type tricarboxylate transporter receptor subunit TctC